MPEYDIPDLGTGDNDGDLNIPDLVDGDEVDVSLDEEKEMAAFDSLHEQAMAQLGQTGVVAQNNFVTVQKLADYDYFENKRMVTLDEAIGVREVSPGPYALKSGQ